MHSEIEKDICLCYIINIDFVYIANILIYPMFYFDCCSFHK